MLEFVPELSLDEAPVKVSVSVTISFRYPLSESSFSSGICTTGEAEISEDVLLLFLQPQKTNAINKAKIKESSFFDNNFTTV